MYEAADDLLFRMLTVAGGLNFGHLPPRPLTPDGRAVPPAVFPPPAWRETLGRLTELQVEGPATNHPGTRFLSF
eukprot:7559463-Pyramimonas_sp.AAC.1